MTWHTAARPWHPSLDKCVVQPPHPMQQLLHGSQSCSGNSAAPYRRLPEEPVALCAGGCKAQPVCWREVDSLSAVEAMVEARMVGTREGDDEVALLLCAWCRHRWRSARAQHQSTGTSISCSSRYTIVQEMHILRAHQQSHCTQSSTAWQEQDVPAAPTCTVV